MAEMLKAQAIRGKDDVEDNDEGVDHGEEDGPDLSEPDRDWRQHVNLTLLRRSSVKKGLGLGHLQFMCKSM